MNQQQQTQKEKIVLEQADVALGQELFTIPSGNHPLPSAPPALDNAFLPRKNSISDQTALAQGPPIAAQRTL